MRFSLLLAGGAAVALTACNGEVTSTECTVDPDTVVPAAPEILSPTAGRRDILADDLVIRSSPLASDDPTAVHASSEFEIWAVVDGAPVARIWYAEVSDPAKLTEVTLADGEFEIVSGLSEWTDYVVRARYRAAGSECDPAGAFSPDRLFRTDDGSSYWFDPTVVRSIYLDIPPDSFDAIDAEATPPDCVPYSRNYYPGTVRFEGQTFAGAGMRAKGGCGSARHLDRKAGFKINLSYDDPSDAVCAETRRLHGLKRITLNNMVQDRTMVHERIGYRFYQAMGVPTPRAMHIRVYVNDEYWGLYNHVESVDRRFLDRWYDDDGGMLYEGTYWCDIVPENIPEGLDDSGCISRKFSADMCSPLEPGQDPTDYTHIGTLADQLAALPDGGFYPEIETLFDFDTFLSMWATEAVMAHWDGYAFEIINNYRIYRDPARNRWTIIPHGIDQTFDQELDPFAVQGLLARRCLEEPDCEAAFAARLDQAIDVFTSLDLAADALAIQDLIRPHVVEDPRKEVDTPEWEDRNAQLRAWIAGRPDQVRAAMARRGL